MEYVSTPGAPEAIGPYSQAVVAGGWVFCSGQVPLVVGTRELRNGSIAEATRQVLGNLEAVLVAAGCTRKDVVKTTVYLADLGEFQGMNEEYSAFFGRHRPARATVGVARLPAGARVEIDCIAVRGGGN